MAENIVVDVDFREQRGGTRELEPLIPDDVLAVLRKRGDKIVDGMQGLRPESVLLADSATDLTWEAVRAAGQKSEIEMPREVVLPDVGDELLGAFEVDRMEDVEVSESQILPIQVYFAWLSHQELAREVVAGLSRGGIGGQDRVIVAIDTMENGGQGVLLTEYWLAGRAMGIESQDLARPLSTWADMRSVKVIGDKSIIGVAVVEERDWTPSILPTWQDVVALRTFEATDWSRGEARAVQNFLWRLLISGDRENIEEIARISQKWVAEFPRPDGKTVQVGNPLELLATKYSRKSILDFRSNVRNQIRESVSV